MNVKSFIDSNIFLYTFTTKDERKQALAKALVLDKEQIISVQIINEVSNNLLKKLGLSNADIQEFVDDCYRRYHVVGLEQGTFKTATLLRDKYRFSYYDSLIVAAALLSDCRILYSEDMQHNLLVEAQLTILNPFV